MDFLANWQADQRQVRSFFSRLLDKFAELNANLDFVVRKGVSANLRASGKPGALSRPLFCLVDVVKDVDNTAPGLAKNLALTCNSSQRLR